MWKIQMVYYCKNGAVKKKGIVINFTNNASPSFVWIRKVIVGK